MSVRQIAKDMAGLSPNYCEINREERNYAAILFAVLCKPDNAKRFLEQCLPESKPGYGGSDFGIYLEYSYLRDLWNEIESDTIKKKIICHNLKIKGIDAIMDWSAEKINRKFGVGRLSDKTVQYPGNWSISKFNDTFEDIEKEDFLEICKFKWAFNIKPDIVIHLDRDRAICIEAKLESGEGSYPTSTAEKTIFKNRGLKDKHVKQMDLQEYMMKDLLGLDTSLILLGLHKIERKNFKFMHWEKAFGCLDLNGMPPFAVKMVRKISAEDN